MGNRAVITTKKAWEFGEGLGVYIHWNGGRQSVEAFLKYCDIMGFRAPEDDNYGWARLVQVIANFMGADGLSVGIDMLSNLDCNNGDNGTYLIEGWEHVRHVYDTPYEEDFDVEDMLCAIDEAQPQDMHEKYCAYMNT